MTHNKTAKVLFICMVLLFSGVRGSTTQWEHINPALDITCFAVDGTKVFAGTQDLGIYISVDDGASWTAVDSGLPKQNTTTYKGILSLASCGGIVFAAVWESGIYEFSDGAQRWMPVNAGLPKDAVQGTNAYCLSAIGTDLFAGITLNKANDPYVFRSDNSGSSWIEADTGLPAIQDSRILAFASGGTYLLAATDTGVFKSGDYGVRWAKANTGLPVKGSCSVLCFAVSGSSVFAGNCNDHEVYRSDNNGDSWTPLNAGQRFNTEINALALTGTYLFAGTDDDVYFSPDLGAHWSSIIDSSLLQVQSPYTAALAVQSFIISGQYLIAGMALYATNTQTNQITKIPVLSRLSLQNVASVQEPEIRQRQFPHIIETRSTRFGDIGVRFFLSAPRKVMLDVYDVSGKTMIPIVNGYCCAGINEFTWNTRNVSSGCYLLRLKTNETTVVRRIDAIR